jgi:N-acylneuraminate cytidylyltransferase
MKNIIAFIFARSGSKRLKNKNLRLIAKKPLIFYSINIAKKIKSVKDIYVSTDSKKIAKISKKYGAKVIMRPKYLASSKSEEFLSWKHSVNYLEKKGIKFDIFLSLPCTAPLRNKSDVYKCIKKLNKQNDIVISSYNFAVRDPLSIKLIKTSEEEYFLAKNPKKIKVTSAYNLTTVAYVTTPSYIKNNKKLLDGKVSLVKIPMPRAIDINDETDFKLAKYIIEKNEC